ncbi:autotransporter serine protease [Pseudoxanthomonas dokdonensis]|uniref:Autotransporter domain-containing protein n=1 Tax=Pseudoxanthomonas dokdonensis TaxID=344882 RepID=A0A0R0CMS7_9GAMM|nr:autotransporter serine protease [Pseudoxanthomonas dokdonensis]KRG70981.1 hypothetical protein ABB29_03880 [Pseudoxanthomonas dokdonensis]
MGKQKLLTRYIVLAIASGMLSACGGGGGGNTRPDPPPPAPPSPPPTAPPGKPVVATPNPGYSHHLAWTGADAARASGLTGKGVTVGIVDSGVNRYHPALYPRVVSNLTYLDPASNDLSRDDVVGHGTAVAQALGGTAFGQWPGGVAPGVSIVSARIIGDTPPEDDGSGEGNEVDGALGLKSIHQDLINRGARIMNNSWGGLYWNNRSATAPIADEYRPFITSNGGLVVFAAGNESRTDPSDMAALPSQTGVNGSLPARDLEAGWLTVVALDENDRTALAGYSNACGVARDYCLAAPGSVVVTGTEDTSTEPKYYEWQGTSLAAPLVSGAAALVWEKFPYFSNDQVRQTLLGTATDLGAAGTDAVFGHGGLNVEAAINGPGRLDWGLMSVDFSGESIWSNVLSGAGGVIKRGSGTLTLSSDALYSGQTRVLAGTLVAEHGLSADALVEAGASLELIGRDIGGSLDNRGYTTFNGASAAGPRQVGGDLRQAAGATLGVQIGAPLQIAGSAQLDGTLQVEGIAPGYVWQSRELVVNASGGLSGSFAQVQGASNVFLQASAEYDANNAWLEISRLDITAAARAMANASPLALASARRVESAFQQIDQQLDAATGPRALAPSLIELAGHLQAASTEASALSSLDSLSGQLHARADAMTLDSLDMNRRAIGQRADVLLAGRGSGNWYQALAGAGRGGLSADGFQLDGWMMGHEQRLAGGAVLGMAFGESHASNRDNSADRGQDRQAMGVLYAGMQWNNGYLLGQAGWGDYQRQVQRSLQFGDRYSRVGTDYGGQTFNATLEAGYRWGNQQRALTPYLGLDHTRLQRDGFIEAGGGGFGLRTVDSSSELCRGIAGVRANLIQGRWQLRGFAEWQQLLGQGGQPLQASFTGLDAWSPLSPGNGYQSHGVVGMALDRYWGQRTRMSLGYDQTLGSVQSDHQVSAQLSVGF